MASVEMTSDRKPLTGAANEQLSSPRSRPKRKRDLLPPDTTGPGPRLRRRRNGPRQISAPDIAAYEYSKLNHDRKQFRLLGFAGLDSYKGADVPPCRLYTFDFDQAPPYDAISYTWGQTEHVVMLVDERPLLVPESAQDALYYLCHKAVRSAKHDHVAFLWIDAVCINQEDLEERSAQVAFMGQIYSTAQNVLIFLGLPMDGDRELLELVEKAAVELRASFSNNRGKLLDALCEQHEEMPPFPRTLDDNWITKLFRSGWFCRLWVIQEVYLSKHCMAFYGLHGAELDYIVTIGKWKANESFAESQTVPLALRQCGILLRDYHHCPQDHSGPCIMGDCHSGYDLERAMIFAESAISTDPKDKVYGIIGLCRKDILALIQPDYTQSVAEVYTQATRVCITERASCEVLQSSRGEYDKDLAWYKEWHWPTWVPLWNNGLGSGNYRQFNASRSGPPCVRSSALNDPILRFHGVLLDSVSRSGITPKELAQAKLERGDQPTGNTRSCQRLSARSLQSCEKLSNMIFTTCSGYEGRYPDRTDVCRGDIVCVPYGSENALVLRPEDDHFLFIGACHVGSLEHEDVFDDDNVPKLGKEQWFEVH